MKADGLFIRHISYQDNLKQSFKCGLFLKFNSYSKIVITMEGPMNILIVEDEQPIRELYIAYLKRLGLDSRITVTTDGIEAFMKCSFEKFDVILLDHVMPRMNGLDLLTALRNGGLNTETSIIVSSGVLPEMEISPEGLTNTYFLKKPMNFNQLDQLLQSML